MEMKRSLHPKCKPTIMANSRMLTLQQASRFTFRLLFWIPVVFFSLLLVRNPFLIIHSAKPSLLLKKGPCSLQNQFISGASICILVPACSVFALRCCSSPLPLLKREERFMCGVVRSMCLWCCSLVLLQVYT